MVEASNGTVIDGATNSQTTGSTSSSNTSSTSSSCCPKGSWGALAQTNQDDGPTPKGNVITLDNNLQVYHVSTSTRPANGGENDSTSKTNSASRNKKKKILLVMGDIYGWSTRTKGICDTLSSKDEYYDCVLMPDFFRGETIINNPENGDFLPWIQKFTFTKVQRDVESCLKYIKEQHQESSMENIEVDLLGFCWGAWVCMKLASIASGNDHFNLGKIAVAHPALQIESMAFGGNHIELMKTCVKHNSQWCMLVSEDEPDECKEDGEIYNVIKNNCGIVNVYSNMKHGWIARGDCTQSDVKEQCLHGLQTIETFLIS